MKKQNKYSRQSPWDHFTVEATGFNPCHKNELQGYATVRVNELGLKIKNISVFRKDNKTTIATPANPPCKENGMKWFPIMDFDDKRDFEIFQKKVVEALEIYFDEDDLDHTDLGTGIVLL